MNKLTKGTSVIENRHIFWNIKKGRKTIVQIKHRRHGVILSTKGVKVKVQLSDGNIIDDKLIYWSKWI